MSTHLPEGKGTALPAITVSPAGLAHLSATAELLDEMGRFYGTASARPADERHRQVREALFATPPAARALLARDQSRLAGIAAYSFLWPAAGLTRSLYLKELYVATTYRRRGIGTLLMRSLIEVATEHGCSRVEWTADTGSAAAQASTASSGYRRCRRRSSTGSRTTPADRSCPADPAPRPPQARRTRAFLR